MRMIPITNESIDKLVERVVFIQVNKYGRSPEEVRVPMNDEAILYLIRNQGNVLRATEDFLDSERGYPSSHEIVLSLYSQIIELKDRIEKLESYLMDRDDFEDATENEWPMPFKRFRG